MILLFKIFTNNGEAGQWQVTSYDIRYKEAGQWQVTSYDIRYKEKDTKGVPSELPYHAKIKLF